MFLLFIVNFNVRVLDLRLGSIFVFVGLIVPLHWCPRSSQWDAHAFLVLPLRRRSNGPLVKGLLSGLLPRSRPARLSAMSSRLLLSPALGRRLVSMDISSSPSSSPLLPLPPWPVDNSTRGSAPGGIDVVT